jgi:hypothetical protein
MAAAQEIFFIAGERREAREITHYELNADARLVASDTWARGV